MDRGVGAAAKLAEGNRKGPAIQALARSGTVSGLAAQHGVCRKFIYQQTHKARAVLAEAFPPAVPDSEALFELIVTKAILLAKSGRFWQEGRPFWRGSEPGHTNSW